MQSPVNFFTVEEYLQLEQTSEIRHEYLGAQIFAMSGGSKQHNIITLNIASRVRSHLRGASCSVFVTDIKVRIELVSQHKSIFYYPDVILLLMRKALGMFPVYLLLSLGKLSILNLHMVR